jgi:hypothetical protein
MADDFFKELVLDQLSALPEWRQFIFNAKT